MEKESQVSQMQCMKLFFQSKDRAHLCVSVGVMSKRVVKLEDGPAVCFHFRQTGGLLTCWSGRLQAESLCRTLTLSETFP